MAHVASYITLVRDSEQRLAESLATIGEAHAQEPDVLIGTRTLAELSRHHVADLQPIVERYATRRAEHAVDEPDDFFTEPIVRARGGPIGLVRDLQDLVTITAFVRSTWLVVDQGAKAMKDEDLKSVADRALHDNELQARWLRTSIKTTAPQALVLAS